MKISNFLLLPIFFLLLLSTNLYSKTITFLGDSRAQFFVNPEEWIRNAIYSDEIQLNVIADSDRDPKSLTFKNIGEGGTQTWLWALKSQSFKNPGTLYQSDYTIISLGGNDILLNFYNTKHGMLDNIHRYYESIFATVYNFVMGQIGNPDAMDDYFNLYVMYVVFSWSGNVMADIASMNLNTLMSNILDPDTGADPPNKVMLSDIALFTLSDKSLIDTSEGVYFMNLLANIFNMKYRDVLVKNLHDVYGEDRVQYLESAPYFWSNISKGAYSIDGVHFSDLGNKGWGRLIAKRFTSCNWLARNPDLCTGSDVTPPSFNIPASGYLSGWSIWPAPDASLPLQFNITDDGTLLDVENASSVSGNTYQVVLNGQVMSGTVTVKATDTCGNKGGIRIDYNKTYMGGSFIGGWAYYFYNINYTVTNL